MMQSASLCGGKSLIAFGDLLYLDVVISFHLSVLSVRRCQSKRVYSKRVHLNEQRKVICRCYFCTGGNNDADVVENLTKLYFDSS